MSFIDLVILLRGEITRFVCGQWSPERQNRLWKIRSPTEVYRLTLGPFYILMKNKIRGARPRGYRYKNRTVFRWWVATIRFWVAAVTGVSVFFYLFDRSKMINGPNSFDRSRVPSRDKAGRRRLESRRISSGRRVVVRSFFVGHSRARARVCGSADR